MKPVGAIIGLLLVAALAFSGATLAVLPFIAAADFYACERPDLMARLKWPHRMMLSRIKCPPSGEQRE
jgi:hypothetical protein